MKFGISLDFTGFPAISRFVTDDLTSAVLFDKYFGIPQWRPEFAVQHPQQNTSFHGQDAVPVTTKVLAKSKNHPEITNRYRRIKARRGHKKAIIAICRMLLTAIWHILSDLKPYTPDGFAEPRPAEKSKVLTTAQALSLLKQRGYIISDPMY